MPPYRRDASGPFPVFRSTSSGFTFKTPFIKETYAKELS